MTNNEVDAFEAEDARYAALVARAYQRTVPFWEAVRRFWSRWTLRGRASRSEYWYAQLFLILAWLAEWSVCLLVAQSGNLRVIVAVNALSWVWDWVTAGLNILLSVRRLHDTGRSGWWFFIHLIPIVGVILEIIWMCQASEPCENAYGPVPNCDD